MKTWIIGVLLFAVLVLGFYVFWLKRELENAQTKSKLKHRPTELLKALSRPGKDRVLRRAAKEILEEREKK